MNAASPKTSIFAAAAAMALAPAAALIFLSPSASAQTRGQAVSASVEIAIASADRANASPVMRQQIQAAARKACAAVATHSPLLPREQADCVRNATADAMRQVERTADIVIASRK